MPQYPVPQFIESEGKIISFLTFRQFFVLVGGGAICAILYYTLPFALFVVVGGLVAVITGSSAFLKVDNVSIVTILLNFLTFSASSKNYVWQKKQHPYPFGARGPEQLRKSNVKGFPAQENNNALGGAKKIVELRKK